MMGSKNNYIDPKTVLDNVKNTAKINIWVYIWLFGKIQWLIGYQISLIVIARQPKYHRFYALVHIQIYANIQNHKELTYTNIDKNTNCKDSTHKYTQKYKTAKMAHTKCT